MQRAAVDHRAVRAFLDRDAQRAQAGGHRGEAVGFLHPQLGDATHDGSAAGDGGGDEEGRELVDHVRHQRLRQLDAAQRRVAHHEVADRLAAAAAFVLDADVRAHQPECVQQADTPRVEADRAQAQLGARHEAGGDEKKRGRGEIRRHVDVDRMQGMAAFEPRVAGRKIDRPAEGGEHALGVVAGRMRLDHLGHAFGIEPGEQQRRLHLRARHRQFVADAVQAPAAVDDERRQAVPRVDACAHAGERLGDAAHRPARERGIADERAVEALPGEQAGEQAHAGAGVAAIERLRTAAQAIQTHAVHDALAVARRLDPHAELRHDGRGGAGVLAFQETADARGALRDRSQHQRAVRDRLVARHRELAAQGSAGAAAPVDPRRAAHGNATG